MFPTRTYRVVGVRPNGDRIIVWEWLSRENAVRLHQALIARSNASQFIIEMDDGPPAQMSTVEPIQREMALLRPGR